MQRKQKCTNNDIDNKNDDVHWHTYTYKVCEPVTSWRVDEEIRHRTCWCAKLQLDEKNEKKKP